MATDNAYTVLSSGERGNTVSVVVHTLVPVANNDRGIPYRDVLRELTGTPVVSRLAAARLVAPMATQAQLDAGSAFEWTFSIQFSAASTPAQRRDAIEAYIDANAQSEFDRLHNILRDWGFVGVRNVGD